MPDRRDHGRVQQWYGWLLRLYPRHFRDRYAAGMAQTFGDLLRERQLAGQSTFVLVCMTLLETTYGIAQERMMTMRDWRQPAIQAGVVSLFILTGPLMLTLTNPNARLNGGPGGGFDWTLGSFAVMGILLFAAVLGVQFAGRKLVRTSHRMIAGGGIALVFLLVWIELAVDGVSRVIAP